MAHVSAEQAPYGGAASDDQSLKRVRIRHFQQAKERGVPVYTVLVGTPDGVVEEQLTGGYRRIIRVPPNPQTLEQVAATLSVQLEAVPTAQPFLVAGRAAELRAGERTVGLIGQEIGRAHV